MKQKFFIAVLCLLSINYVFSQCVNTNIYTSNFNIVNSGSTLTNKTVRVTVNTQQLISSGQMQANGNDIRFGATCCDLYSFWLDSLTLNTANTVMWVRIPSIPASSTFNLKMFHGSTSLASTSDFNTTFPNRYILNSGIDSLIGTVNYDWFEVKSGATLNIRVGQVLNINSESIIISGTINGIGRGQIGNKTSSCAAGLGIGGGLATGSCANGGGAGYGGLGGCAPIGGAGSCNLAGGTVYGTLTGTDIDMGSSGSTGSNGSILGNGAGNGGGAIRLNAASIRITGTINVSGEDGQGNSNSSSGGGGGSGGGILINGNVLNLSGASLIARGGKAGNGYGGAGGGGRIKIFRRNPIVGTFTTNVTGSSEHTYSGTVLLTSAIGANGTVYQDSINTGIVLPVYVNTQFIPCGLVYYSKSTGVLNDTLSWSTNINGTGTNPPNFSSSGALYYVVNNGSPTINSNWFITGTNSLIIFGDGINSGNFLIPSGLTFGADTFHVSKDFTFTVQGQIFTNRPSFNSNSTVQYLLNSSQNMIAGTYGNLVVSGATKNLTGNTSVAGVLAMFNNINCNSFSLTLGVSALQTGTLNRSSGTIIGNFRRWFAPTVTTGSSGLFPIGNSTFYRPFQVNFTSSPTNGGILGTEFISSNPGNSGFPLFDFTNSPIVQLNKTSPNGFWRVTASDGIAGGTYSCSATGTGFFGISDVSTLRLVRRNSISSSWALPGSSIIGSGTSLSPIAGRTSISVLGGDFTFASDSTSNTLPVKLLSFTANKKETNVNLKWATASELNADRFEIQKRTEKNWSTIANVKAGGNSQSVRNYSFIDTDALLETKDAYYRLKMIDIDGTTEYSSIIKVTDNVLNTTLNLLPNPFHETLIIDFGNTEDQKVNISVYDMMGKQLISSNNINIEANTKFEYTEVSNLNPGIYYISLFVNDQHITKKIIKL